MVQFHIWSMWFLSSLIYIYYPFFIALMLAGMFIAISRTSWFIIWIGLEINIYSFIPILLHFNIYKRKETTAKYFLVQALGSARLLVATLAISTQPTISSILFIFSLLLKAGLPPIHFWFPRIMAILPWFSCFLLTTLQKIAPTILLIHIFPKNSEIILLLGAIIALTGALGGINQTQLRTILAYSSISQTGWIIASAQLTHKLSSIVFINYILTISAIILILSFFQWTSANESNILILQPKIITIFLITLLINLAGIPPFPGFFFKILILYKLALIKAIKSRLILILSSIISLYFYIKIIINSFIRISRKVYIKEPLSTFTLKITLVLVFLLRVLVLVPISPFFIYAMTILNKPQRYWNHIFHIWSMRRSFRNLNKTSNSDRTRSTRAILRKRSTI